MMIQSVSKTMMIQSVTAFLLSLLSASQAFQVTVRPLTTKAAPSLSYSNTLEVPAPIAINVDLEEQMKKIISKQQQQGKPQLKQTKTAPATNVREASTQDDYKALVGDETEKVTVVRFYAPWCRACHRTAPLFDRLAAAHPNVNFVKVPVSEDTKHVMAAMGVTKLPYGQIYHPIAGLAEELSMNKVAFRDFQRILDSYLDNECELPELSPYTKMYESPYRRMD
jgi:thiol-disulfide isomerase/thioredoxin